MCVCVEEVKVGILLVVKVGEMVLIDGIVIFGKCSVDESSLMGEFMLVEKDEGVNVWVGIVNMLGVYSLLFWFCYFIFSMKFFVF